MTAGTRRKRCRECNKLFPPEDLSRGLCEGCEEDYVWCDCCDDWQHTSDPCRHVFWTDSGWGGSGTIEVDWAYFRGPFFALLDVLASLDPGKVCLHLGQTDLVAAMEAEIAADRFWTRLDGFLLSRPTLYLYRLRPDLPQRNEDGSPIALFFARIEPSQIDPDDDRVEDEYGEGAISYGFAWLQSLCADDTPEANQQTVAWIREWRSRRAAGTPTTTTDAKDAIHKALGG